MHYRVKFQAGYIIYTEWFSYLYAARDVAEAMEVKGIDVLAVEDENYEEVG